MNLNKKEYLKEYYLKNKDKFKNYYTLNKDKKSKYNHDWYIKNKSTKKEYDKLRAINNKHKNKEYYLKNKNIIYQRTNQYLMKNKEQRFLTNYKYSDKKKSLICNLTIEWIKENITSKSCTYCGDTENISCDRIDNSKGHTKDNCVPCCYTCNKTRMNNYSFEEMKEIGLVIKRIKERRKLVCSSIVV